jgi:hypothetical protein
MSPARFEPAIVARKRPRTHALVSAATGICYYQLIFAHILDPCYVGRKNKKAWHDWRLHTEETPSRKDTYLQEFVQLHHCMVLNQAQEENFISLTS